MVNMIEFNGSLLNAGENVPDSAIAPTQRGESRRYDFLGFPLLFLSLREIASLLPDSL
jgi:hypothetical protein